MIRGGLNTAVHDRLKNKVKGRSGFHHPAEKLSHSVGLVHSLFSPLTPDAHVLSLSPWSCASSLLSIIRPSNLASNVGSLQLCKHLPNFLSLSHPLQSKIRIWPAHAGLDRGISKQDAAAY